MWTFEKSGVSKRRKKSYCVEASGFNKQVLTKQLSRGLNCHRVIIVKNNVSEAFCMIQKLRVYGTQSNETRDLINLELLGG